MPPYDGRAPAVLDLPTGRLVRLRLPRPEDQPLIDGWSLPCNRSAWNTHDKPPRTIAERLAAGPLVGENGGMLLIVRLADERPVGDIAWKPAYYGRSGDTRSRAWRIGREILAEARGHGLGSEAMSLLVGWLFRNTDANRVDGYTEDGNIAAQRSLAKAGWLREGVLRGALYRAGGYHDVIMYAMIRADWARLT
jgi:RimJ/RimL family protein N-acetyltransferase